MSATNDARTESNSSFENDFGDNSSSTSWDQLFRQRLVEGGGFVARSLTQSLKWLQIARRNYARLAESAEGEDVFKYLLLINVTALEEYITQTRLQADQSFRLSKRLAGVGFILIALGIIAGVYSQLFLERQLEFAYLAAIAGVLTQFTAGVFFYLYNQTLQQVNYFYTELQTSQKVAIGLVLNSTVTDEIERNHSKMDLAKILVSSYPQLFPDDLRKQVEQIKTKTDKNEE